tara:strand:+ start:10 stop:975 length:966 start_codon:yes stop_codon:yes gene_type:complete
MIKIKKFSKNNYDIWDSFVLKSNNGTLFHLRKFLSYHPEDRFKDHSLEIYKKNTLLSVFPAADIIINDKKLLASHPGSSYGSFIAKEELSIKDAMEIVSKLIDYSSKKGFEGIQLTIPPGFHSNRASNYIEYSLLFNGFDYFRRDVTSILTIESSEDKILNKFKPSHQRALRKSIKLGVKTRVTDKVDEFFSILKNNLKIRHGVDPTHSLKELKSLIELFPDSINIFGAFYEKKMIAGVLNIVVKEGVALAFYISHKEGFQELRPLNLLFFDIFKWSLKNNIKVYDFGTFTDKGIANMGLGRFKESFGASGVFRDSFKILF